MSIKEWRVDSLGCNAKRSNENFKLIVSNLMKVSVTDTDLIKRLGKPAYSTETVQRIEFRYLTAGRCFSEIKDSCWGTIVMDKNKSKVIDSYITCQ